MSITKVILDRQAVVQVLTFGGPGSPAQVTLHRGGAPLAQVLLENQGSEHIAGNLTLDGALNLSPIGLASLPFGWLSGLTPPSNAIGVEGQNYYQSTTGQVYKKTAGVWNLDFTISGSGATAGAQYLLGVADPGLPSGRVALSSPSIAVNTSVANAVVFERTALLGDVTATQNSSVTTIAPGVVTNVKLADMPGLTIKGNPNAGVSAPSDLTATEVKTLLAIAPGDIAGLAPIASSGSASDLTSGTIPAARQTGLTGDVTVPAGSDVATIPAGSITFAKIQPVAANAALGRSASTPGDVTETVIGPSELFGRGASGDLAPIVLGTNLSMTGTTLNATGGGGGGAPTTAEYLVAVADATLTNERVALSSNSIDVDFTTAGQARFHRAALTGDVTAAAGDNATVIANGVVTNAKLADMPANTFKGNNTGASAVPLDLTAAQVKAALAISASDVSGLAPIATSGSAADLTTGTVSAARFPAQTGDVTSAAGTFSSTIAPNVVTNAKLAQAPAFTFKGNATGAAGNVQDLSVGQAKTLLFITPSDISGLAPIASSGSASDLTTGTLAAARLPAFTGDVTTVAGTSVTTIAPQSVTYAKIQNAGANTVITRANSASGTVGETALGLSELLGRGSTGDIAPIVLGANLSMTGTTLSAAGGGAPIGAEYLVVSPDATLTNERFFSASTTNTFNVSVPGQFSVERAALTGDVTAPQNSNATTIANGVVSNAKLATMPANTVKVNATNAAASPTDLTLAASELLGRGSAGDISAITLGTNLSMSGTTLNATAGGGGAPTGAEYIVATADPTLTAERVATSSASITVNVGTAGQAAFERAALTGDVTAAADSNATTIAAGVVTNAKLAQAPANTLKGNNTGAAAQVADLTPTQVKTMLAITSADVSGLATIATSGSAADLTTGTLSAARLPALTGDVTTTAGSAATTISPAAVTYAKIQNVSAEAVLTRAANTSGTVGETILGLSQLLGRGDSGDIAPITLGTNLTMSGTTLNAASGGGGAPVGAEYLVATPDATLTNERAFSSSTTNTFNVATPGQFAVERAALTGDVTAAQNSNATTIANNVVTNAKLAQAPANTIKGNNTGATANEADLTVAQVKTMLAISAADVSGLATVATSGSAADLTAGTLAAARLPAFTGDVTTTAGSAATTIANGVVTNAKLATMPANTFKGNNTGATAAPADLTAAQVKTALAITAGDVSGLAAVATTGSAASLTGTLAAAQLPAFTGDVTSGPNNAVNVIAAGVVTNAKLATMPANTVKVNATAATAAPTDLALAANQLLGRGSTGNIEPIILGTNLSMTGATLNAAGGSGAPGGATTQVQFNNAGAFDGNAGLTFDPATQTLGMLGTDPEIVMAVSAADTPAPAAGRIALFADEVAGDIVWMRRSPVGLAMPLQDSLAFKNFKSVVPGTGTGLTTGTSGIGASFTNVGTLANPGLAATNLGTQTRRVTFSTGATAGAMASHRQQMTEVWRGNAAGLGGFRLVMRLGMNTFQAGQRGFFGIQSSVIAPTNVDPLTSSAGAKIGIAFNTNTGNWQIIHGANLAAPTVINTTIPINITSMLDLIIFCAPNAANMNVKLIDLSTGTRFSVTPVTNLPDNTLFLAPQFWITNNAAAAAVIANFYKWTLESDY